MLRIAKILLFWLFTACGVCLAQPSQKQDTLHCIRGYELSHLPLDIKASVGSIEGHFTFYNTAFKELIVMDTAAQNIVIYGRKYFADSTKFMNLKVLFDAYKELNRYVNVLKPYKMNRMFVESAYTNKSDIFLLLRIPKVFVTVQKNDKRLFTLSYNLAIVQVSPERVISCQFIKNECGKYYEVDNTNAFYYNREEGYILSLLADTLLPKSALLASFKEKKGELVMTQKSPLTGQKLLGDKFHEEHFFSSYTHGALLWYANPYGQFIDLQKKQVYNLLPVLSEFLGTSECRVIDAKLFEENQLGVIIRGHTIELFYAILSIEKDKSLRLVKSMPLNVPEKNLNTRSWSILAPDKLAHYGFDHRLNIYTITTK